MTLFADTTSPMSSSSAHPRTLGCTILGSGSKGNASVIHGPEGNLLLDAGFSAKELLCRLERVRVEPRSLRADRKSVV